MVENQKSDGATQTGGFQLTGKPKAEGVNLEALKKRAHIDRALSSREQALLHATENLTKPLRSVSETMAGAFAGLRSQQEHLRDHLGLGVLGEQNSALRRATEQIANQQNTIKDMLDSSRFVHTELPNIPDIPPNPLYETNARLERIEERFEEMQTIAANAADIATSLQAAAAEFLEKFQHAAAENDRITRRAIWLGIAAVVIAVIMPASQIIYAELHRDPDFSAEVMQTVQTMQSELTLLREAQTSAADRLAEAMAGADRDTAAILQDIRTLLAGQQNGASESSEDVSRE